jgi:hypothetical protein
MRPPAAPATQGYGGARAAVRGLGAGLVAAQPEVGIPLLVANEALGVITDATKAMKEFAARTFDSNKNLAQYNGQLAIAYTRLNIGDFYRGVNLANRTAPGGEAFVKAVDRMRDSLQEFSVLQKNAGNQLGVFGARLTEDFGRAFEPFAAKLNEVMGKDPGASFAEGLADTLAKIPTMLADVLREKLGLAPAVEKKKDFQLGPWDDLVGDIIRGKIGGPILPGVRGGPPLGGAPMARFGRVI